jgi:outer membrane protein assembly factor BamB
MLGERHGTLTVFEMETGAERWQMELPDRIDGAPATAGGLVFLSTGGALVAFDAESGGERWRFAAGDLLATPALSGEVVYLAAGHGIPVDGSGDLFALDAATGTVRWRFSLPHVMVSPPAIANGVVYVSSADPYVGGQLVAVGSA